MGVLSTLKRLLVESTSTMMFNNDLQACEFTRIRYTHDGADTTCALLSLAPFDMYTRHLNLIIDLHGIGFTKTVSYRN
jgi:hypothetical protein